MSSIRAHSVLAARRRVANHLRGIGVEALQQFARFTSSGRNWPARWFSHSSFDLGLASRAARRELRRRGVSTYNVEG